MRPRPLPRPGLHALGTWSSCFCRPKIILSYSQIGGYYYYRLPASCAVPDHESSLVLAILYLGCHMICEPAAAICTACIYIYIHTYIHTYIYIYICVCVCVCVCIHICVSVCWGVSVSVCVYVRVEHSISWLLIYSRTCIAWSLNHLPIEVWLQVYPGLPRSCGDGLWDQAPCPAAISTAIRSAAGAAAAATLRHDYDVNNQEMIRAWFRKVVWKLAVHDMSNRLTVHLSDLLSLQTLLMVRYKVLSSKILRRLTCSLRWMIESGFCFGFSDAFRIDLCLKQPFLKPGHHVAQCFLTFWAQACRYGRCWNLRTLQAWTWTKSRHHPSDSTAMLHRFAQALNSLNAFLIFCEHSWSLQSALGLQNQLDPGSSSSTAHPASSNHPETTIVPISHCKPRRCALSLTSCSVNQLSCFKKLLATASRCWRRWSTVKLECHGELEVVGYSGLWWFRMVRLQNHQWQPMTKCLFSSSCMDGAKKGSEWRDWTWFHPQWGLIPPGVDWTWSDWVTIRFFQVCHGSPHACEKCSQRPVNWHQTLGFAWDGPHSMLPKMHWKTRTTTAWAAAMVNSQKCLQNESAKNH